jgi:hypothetical protein
MGEGRAEASPIHQDEDSPSIAWDMFLHQRTWNYLSDCTKRLVELGCGTNIPDCASIPPLTPELKPRDTCFDDRGKADLLDRALEVGRITQNDGLWNRDSSLARECRQGALVMSDLNRLKIWKRKRREPVKLRSGLRDE